MQLTQFAVDDSPHNRDGLVLHGWDGDQQVIGFISRRVMADWAEPGCYGKQKSLFRKQYNALGKRNLAAIEQIEVSAWCGVQPPAPLRGYSIFRHCRKW